jgi:hypothetical protein
LRRTTGWRYAKVLICKEKSPAHTERWAANGRPG